MEDIERIARLIPDESLVSFCGRDYGDWRLNATLERFHRIKLTRNLDRTSFILVQNHCSKQKMDEITKLGFSKVTVGTSTVYLYAKSKE